MKRDDFYFFSLVVLFLLGVLCRWPLGLRVAVATNSALVLLWCGRRLWGEWNAR